MGAWEQHPSADHGSYGTALPAQYWYSYSPYPYYVAPPPYPPTYAPPQAPAPQTMSGPPPQQFWYYCDNPKGYYFQVQNCPTAWRQVAAPPSKRP